MIGGSKKFVDLPFDLYKYIREWPWHGVPFHPKILKKITEVQEKMLNNNAFAVIFKRQTVWPVEVIENFDLV